MDDLEAIAVLQEPLRRGLYEYVVAQDHPVSRNEAAEALGVQRTLAAFHLDKLAEAGLLDTAHRRLSGRTGPGAGRPAKVYSRSADERQVSVPPRDYRTAAELLADVADGARLDVELQQAARRHGRALRGDTAAADLPAAVDLLRRRGHEPYVDGELVRMRNCPFHALSETHTALVCGMNLALLQGLLEGVNGVTVALDPRPDHCCTVLTASNDNHR
jgi:predicted ArsR family transcriptional regulator